MMRRPSLQAFATMRPSGITNTSLRPLRQLVPVIGTVAISLRSVASSTSTPMSPALVTFHV